MGYWGKVDRGLLNDAGDYVVVVGFGDLGSVEGAGDKDFVGAEVVDEDLAVDLGGLVEGAALPEEFGFVGLAFDEDVYFAPNPVGSGGTRDFLLELHQLAATGFYGALRDFLIEREGTGTFFVGVGEDAKPVDFGGGDEGAEFVEVLLGFAGEADDEAGAEDEAGDGGAGLRDDFEEAC